MKNQRQNPSHPGRRRKKRGVAKSNTMKSGTERVWGGGQGAITKEPQLLAEKGRDAKG